LFIVRVRGLVVPDASLDQPLNWYPLEGIAFIVTVDPSG
jgi:hypothetical protein